jgi:hypothetical protein
MERFKIEDAFSIGRSDDFRNCFELISKIKFKDIQRDFK